MKIQVELRKWGNSLGLRIPYQIANNLEITENSKVSLVIERDCLIVRKENPMPNLDEILDSIPDNFEYPEDIADFVNSESVGNELV
jgi:antitoxin MazE